MTWEPTEIFESPLLFSGSYFFYSHANTIAYEEYKVIYSLFQHEKLIENVVCIQYP